MHFTQCFTGYKQMQTTIYSKSWKNRDENNLQITKLFFVERRHVNDEDVT